MQNTQTMLSMDQPMSASNPMGNVVVSNNSTPQCNIPDFQDFATALDIYNLPSVPDSYLAEGLIPRETLSILFGSSDAGKSAFARQLSLGIVFGKGDFLGYKLNIKHRRVLYVSTEDGKNDWKRKLDRLKLDPSEVQGLENLIVLNAIDPNLTAKIVHYASQKPMDLIVIDVLTDFFTGNLNDAIDMRRHFLPYKKIAQELDASVLFITHAKKAADKSDGDKTDIAGTHAIEAASRCVLRLNLDSNDPDMRTLKIVKANSLPQSEKMKSIKLRFNNDLTFTATGEIVEDGGTKKGAITTNREVIIKVLELKEQKLTMRKIAEQLTKEGIIIGKTSVETILSQNESPRFLSTRDIEIKSSTMPFKN